MDSSNTGKQSSSLKDIVFEPRVHDVISKMESSGMSQSEVADKLVENYTFSGQLCTLFAGWLQDMDTTNEAGTSELGAVATKVFEDNAYKMVGKVFSTDSADRIFDSTDGVDWLPELIAHRPWRRLIYELAENHPQCLMLNLAVKLISDAGFESEISNVSTAANQLEIFSKVFVTNVLQLVQSLDLGENTVAFQEALGELIKVSCFDEHTYYYAQAALRVIALRSNAKICSICNFIAQNLRLAADEHIVESTALLLSMIQSPGDVLNPSTIQAVLAMLAKRTLNPADVDQLYQAYYDPNPPPAELIRDPVFIRILVKSLFSDKGVRIDPEFRSRYVYLLAYAACVGEVRRNSMRISKLELDLVRSKIDELLDKLESNDDLVQILPDIIKLMKTPVLAAGMLSFVESLILNDEFTNETQNVHLVIVDQVSKAHPNLRHMVFRFLCRLYDSQSRRNELAEVVISRQKVVIDRFVNLLACGYVVPILERIRRLYDAGSLDVSLVRYFGIQVLDLVAPPYSDEFLNNMVPLVSRVEIFDRVPLEKRKLVTEFLDYAHS